MNATIQFTCPQCNHQMTLPSSTVGKQGKCPDCGQVVTIAAPAVETPADVRIDRGSVVPLNTEVNTPALDSNSDSLPVIKVDGDVPAYKKGKKGTSREGLGKRLLSGLKNSWNEAAEKTKKHQQRQKDLIHHIPGDTRPYEPADHLVELARLTQSNSNPGHVLFPWEPEGEWRRTTALQFSLVFQLVLDLAAKSIVFVVFEKKKDPVEMLRYSLGDVLDVGVVKTKKEVTEGPGFVGFLNSVNASAARSELSQRDRLFYDEIKKQRPPPKTKTVEGLRFVIYFPDEHGFDKKIFFAGELHKDSKCSLKYTVREINKAVKGFTGDNRSLEPSSAGTPEPEEDPSLEPEPALAADEQNDIAISLQKLARLYEMELITEEEFQLKRQELLDQL